MDKRKLQSRGAQKDASGAARREKVAADWGRKNGLCLAIGEYPFADLWAAIAAAKEGKLGEEEASASASRISTALGRRRVIYARESLLGESLWELAQALDGKELLNVRVAWVRGAEAAEDGARGLGLHAYWMAKAIREDDDAELAGLLRSGAAPENVSAKDMSALDFAWTNRAERCAMILAPVLASMVEELHGKEVKGQRPFRKAIQLGVPLLQMSWMERIFQREQDSGRFEFIFRDSQAFYLDNLVAALSGNKKPRQASLLDLQQSGALSMAKERPPAPAQEGARQATLAEGLAIWRQWAQVRGELEQAAWVEGLELSLVQGSPKPRKEAPRL